MDALFMDETDWSACGYDFSHLVVPCNISTKFRASDMIAKYSALRATAVALNNAGIWPIFSSKNLLKAAWIGVTDAPTHLPCVISHDGYFEALKGLSYARFYEFWMG